MGNLGFGKSSVGAVQSILCEMAFIDGNNLHPNRNIEKMSSRQPLDDAERAPWFNRVGLMMSNVDGPAVIGRPVLKSLCRDWNQREVTEPVRFLHLDAPKDVLANRVAARAGHFIPLTSFDRQFTALKRLDRCEWDWETGIGRSCEAVNDQSEHNIKETAE